MSWYKSGTIAATNGSKIITGTGTQFTNPLNGVSAGRMLLLPAAGTVQIYEIDSVQSDTQLTLVSAYTGTTGTGKAYAIPTSPAVSIEQFAHEFASTLAYYQQQLSGWQQILTGTGNVTLTTPDGQTVTVRSQKAWDDALNGKVTGVKQTGPFDATAGSLALNTAWGWGGVGQTLNFADDAAFLTWARTLANGSRIFRDDTNAAQYTKQYSAGLLMRASDSWATLSIGYGGSTAQGIRATGGNNSAGATISYELWTDKNLVKQTGGIDYTPGRVLTLSTAGDGSFGLGGTGIRMPPNSDVAAYLRSMPSGFYTILGDATSSNLPGDSQQGWAFYTTRFNTTPTISVIAKSVNINNHQLWHGLIYPDSILWSRVWDSSSLVKQSTPLDTTAGSVLINSAFGLGALDNQYIAGNLNDVQRNGFLRYSNNTTGAPTTNNGYGIHFGYDANAAAQLMVDYSSNLLYFRRKQTGAWTSWTTLMNLESPQVISGAKIFSSSVNIRPNGANSAGLEIGSTTASSSAYIDFHSSGNDIDYDSRILATGGTTGVGQGTLNVIAQSFTWNNYNIATLQRADTFTGTKTFTAMPIVQANNATLGLESLQVSESTVGRWVQVTNTGTQLNFYIRAGSGGAPIATGTKIITIPTAAQGTALVTGNNAVADANGFWKTASPVVKLFADGTNELTSEAEGVTTERLSEGVYRISGCLGLNADLAWGGIEGGISCPKCRNGLERVWNDYDVEADGSIVIRTYHRPHTDAPAFARNEIEGYANGDPIDIPHDTFISVRVQMPEREEPKPKVMHSNVYCNTVAS